MVRLRIGFRSFEFVFVPIRHTRLIPSYKKTACLEGRIFLYVAVIFIYQKLTPCFDA